MSMSMQMISPLGFFRILVMINSIHFRFLITLINHSYVNSILTPHSSSLFPSTITLTITPFTTFHQLNEY